MWALCKYNPLNFSEKYLLLNLGALVVFQCWPYLFWWTYNTLIPKGKREIAVPLPWKVISNVRPCWIKSCSSAVSQLTVNMNITLYLIFWGAQGQPSSSYYWPVIGNDAKSGSPEKVLPLCSFYHWSLPTCINPLRVAGEKRRQCGTSSSHAGREKSTVKHQPISVESKVVPRQYLS